jgi:hypothetical protein
MAMAKVLDKIFPEMSKVAITRSVTSLRLPTYAYIQPDETQKLIVRVPLTFQFMSASASSLSMFRTNPNKARDAMLDIVIPEEAPSFGVHIFYDLELDEVTGNDVIVYNPLVRSMIEEPLLVEVRSLGALREAVNKAQRPEKTGFIPWTDRTTARVKLLGDYMWYCFVWCANGCTASRCCCCCGCATPQGNRY